MKRILSVILCLLLLTVLPCSAYALVYQDTVVDNAQLLSNDDTEKLGEMAWQIYEKYGIFPAIITVNSLGGRSPQAYADDFYDQHYYAECKDGVLLLIAMDTREWAISTCGEAIDALPDWTLDSLFALIAEDLSGGNYYRAFSTYLGELEDLVGHYRDSQVTDAGDYLRIVLISLGIGAAVGGIAIVIMRSQMNTAKAQANAGSYLKNGSYQLKVHHDIFLYSQISKTRKAQNNGSSTHRSSGGVRHGGRSGRF